MVVRQMVVSAFTRRYNQISPNISDTCFLETQGLSSAQPSTNWYPASDPGWAVDELSKGFVVPPGVRFGAF